MSLKWGQLLRTDTGIELPPPSRNLAQLLTDERKILHTDLPIFLQGRPIYRLQRVKQVSPRWCHYHFPPGSLHQHSNATPCLYSSPFSTPLAKKLSPQSVVHGPSPSTSPGTAWEMQNCRPLSRHTESESAFYSIPRWLLHKIIVKPNSQVLPVSSF